MYFFFGGLEFVGHSFAYFAHLYFLGDVWIRTQRAAVASRFATNLAILPPLTGTLQRDGSGRNWAHSLDRQSSLMRVARKVFRKIRPPPILREPFKVLERLLVF